MCLLTSGHVLIIKPLYKHITEVEVLYLRLYEDSRLVPAAKYLLCVLYLVPGIETCSTTNLLND